MTNHLGHFLLTSLLLDKLCESGTAEQHTRIVNVSSDVHKILGTGRKGIVDYDDLNGK